MDIVEFAENICDFSLNDNQKDFLREAYEACKNNKKIIYIPPRGNSKISFEILQSLAILCVGLERGLIKDKED